MDNTVFGQILNDSLQLHEDLSSLLKLAADKKRKDAETAKQAAAAAKPAPAPMSAPTKVAPDTMDGDPSMLEPIADSSLISTDNNNDASPTTVASKLYNDISPEVMVANSIITAIYNSFTNNCDNRKRMNEYFDQVKNWEKQARGACQQVMSIVEASNFDTTNTANCSPKAYKTIVNYNSRDRSAVDLCAAIIIFRNSLKKD
jgi:hypothetical protein